MQRGAARARRCWWRGAGAGAGAARSAPTAASPASPLGPSQKVSAQVDLAANFKAPTAPKGLAGVTVSVGGAYKYSADATLSSKLSADAESGTRRLAVALAQQVSPMAKITFAADLNANDVAKDDHKLYCALAIAA